MLARPEQLPHSFIIHCHVQIRRRNADIGVVGRIADFGEYANSISVDSLRPVRICSSSRRLLVVHCLIRVQPIADV